MENIRQSLYSSAAVPKLGCTDQPAGVRERMLLMIFAFFEGASERGSYLPNQTTYQI